MVLGGEEVSGGWERRSTSQWLGFLRRTKNEDERGVDWVSKREGIFFPSVRRRRLRERGSSCRSEVAEKTEVEEMREREEREACLRRRPSG